MLVPAKNRRSGFNLVELMTVLAVALALAAMILPAVQQTREAARIAACKNNVVQIGLALQNYQMAHRVLPSGSVNTNRPIKSRETSVRILQAAGLDPKPGWTRRNQLRKWQSDKVHSRPQS